MNRKVCVKIRGLHSIGEPDMENDTIEVINAGTYHKRDGKHYVKYEELMEGTDEISNTLLKISDNEVEVISKGATGSHMVFTRGQKNMSYYNTPFGGINLGVDTYDMNIDTTGEAIIVDLEYGLEVNLDFLSKCHVHIEIGFINENTEKG